MAVSKLRVITSIKSQNRSPNRVSIFLDDSFWLGLDRELALSLNLREGQKLRSKEIENIVFQKERKKALGRALRLLSYRARSKKEIKTRLTKTGFSQLIIEDVVAELKKMQYLDDKKFAEMWVEERVNVKKYGCARIKMELFQKGIDRNTIEQTLKEHYPSDEEPLAFELGCQKLNCYDGLDFPAAYRRLSGYLKRRGFSPSIVHRVCQKILQDFPSQ